jgi:HAD superfamily hydrolase (TIGR01549 family)
MNYKGILLDLDNTVYPYDEAHKQALSKSFDKITEIYSARREAIEKSFKKARESVHLELHGTASSHNRLLYFQRTLENLGENPLKHSMEIYNVYWNSFLESMNPFEGAHEFLSLLKDKGLKVCLLTDLTAHIQFRKIEKLKLYDYIDFLVTSEEAGAEKPHPYIFMLAMKKINLTPNEVIMVGDNFAKDITGALNLGIKSYWLDKNGDNEKLTNSELVKNIKNYKELIGIFK